MAATDLLHWRVKDALPVGSSAHTARMVSAIDGALGGVMARALPLSVQSPPLNATDPEMALDGWQGMRVRKASKQEAEEEEAVRNLIPDSPDRLGRQDRRPRKCWTNCRFVLSPVGSVRIRLPDPA